MALRGMKREERRRTKNLRRGPLKMTFSHPQLGTNIVQTKGKQEGLTLILVEALRHKKPCLSLLQSLQVLTKSR
ncbi:MAG: hypothetical protein ACK55I_40560, partial [bacterium]